MGSSVDLRPRRWPYSGDRLRRPPSQQYRYHNEWRRLRDENKFARLVNFARGLPTLRTRLRRDLARPELDRHKVLAAVVRLLEETSIGIGNDEYTRSNGSFGLTTLRNRHVTVQPSGLRLRFRGKGGRVHDVDVADRRVAWIVRSGQELSGQELFQYVAPDGSVHRIDSGDVNDYLRAVTRMDVTAKEFRTWTATVHAAQLLLSRATPQTSAERQRAITETVTAVARGLRNTPAVCRRSYSHPLIFEAFEHGMTISDATPKGHHRAAGMRAIERTVLRLLDDTPCRVRKVG
jgi:DNA topoisomerase I